ncbi:hypothetical protein FGIG_04810 [Fasciola gigantica]|uniref:Uncharacterized protein n=1 Tax=Fasciola gigantica TaxID=46835 RepID=A0A504Z036_FASGI|nr:hypothetical protein FGIG_04810 [Fasciola gigantica]
MTLEWDRAYLTVHELLCSHGLYQSNLNQIKNMTRRYLCSSKNASTICEEFKSHPVPFKELDSNIQLFLIQVVHLLTAQSVLDELYELVTTYSTQQTAISWTHVFALVSSIAVSARGGIVLVKGFIRKLLVFVFQPVSQNEEIESPVNVFEMLPGEVCGQPEDGQAFPTQFSFWNLFCFALRLARQLSAEDVRVTGFTYTQWWIETFCSSTMNAPTSVLRSRSDVTLLIEWLIELLPWEDDPRLLQTQLTHKPFWPVHSTGQKKINNNAQSVMDSPEDPILMDTEVVMAELESIDARSRDCCVQRWNDYVEIARGRLAELRHVYVSNSPEAIPSAHSSSLLGATEIAELSETQKTAHDLPLAAIRQAGLGNLLELGREVPSHTESKRAKSRRAKPTNTVKQSTMQTRLGTLTRPINTRSRTARSARRV